MNQNEFRIGNYVTDTKTGKIVTVDGIQFTGRIVTHDESYDDWKRGIKPIGIPLTPEILEKAGFEKDTDGVYVKMRCLYWLSKNQDEGILQIALAYSPLFNCSCSYVHQLQNIIFALTGEELPIEL